MTYSNLEVATSVSTYHLLNLWLHGKSIHSQRAYRRDIEDFLTWFGGADLTEVSLEILQNFVNYLGRKKYAISTISRKLATLKSLFSFALQLGLIKVNPTTMLKLPTPKNTLPERILTSSQVMKMINLTTNRRDRILVRLLYTTGARVSEITKLTWRDVKKQDNNTASVNIWGKGSKSRVVLISQEMWSLLQELREGGLDTPVFVSRKGGHLDPSQVHRIIRAAAERAGIEGNVSPHWLRHSHASHSLDQGAPIQLVQKSLGHSQITTTERYLHAKPNDSSGLYLGL
jgi:integrase/recombinase XerD